MSPTDPMGGYLVDLKDIEKDIRNHIAEGRIVIVLEPRNRYENLYGVNVMFEDKTSENLYLEVVGPGFDVSDLNRGQVTPHERVLLQRSAECRVLERSTIAPSDYRASVNARLAKIGELVAARQAMDRSLMTHDELVEIGKHFLSANGYGLLLKHSEKYDPIPPEYLKRILYFAHDLPQKMSQMKLDTKLFVLSSTFFERSEELVFWDIAWPEKKYENVCHAIQ